MSGAAKRLLIILLALSLCLCAACTKSDVEENADEIEPDSFADECSEIAIGHTQQINNVLPWFSCDVNWLHNGVYEGLLFFDGDTVSGALADSWSCSSDGLTWRFNIKSDVYFSDGSICDAAAVAASWNNSYRHFPQEFDNCKIKSWYCDGDNAFVVELGSACFWFEQGICDAVFKIVSPSAAELYGISNWKSGIGTGKYKIKSFITGSTLELERNSTYNETPDSGLLETIRFVYFSDQSGKLCSALLEEDIDAALFKSVKTCNELELNAFSGTVTVVSYNINNWWISPQKANVLAEKDARQALSYLIDLNQLNYDVYSGAGIVQDSIWSSEDSLYVHKEYLCDDGRANEILAEAGIAAADLTIELNVGSGEYSLYKELLEQLADFGVSCYVNEIVPESSTFPDVIEPLKANGSGHMNILYAFVTQRISGYESSFTNFVADELAAMNNSADADEFIKDGKELTSFIQDNYAALPLVQEPVFFAVREGAEEQFEALTQTSMFKWMYQQ